MDTLENGSGYCRHLSEPEQFQALLKSVSRPYGGWLANDAGIDHADRCDGSCYDCLRDYSNADLHAVLDWRLALDLSDLAVDAKADLSTDNPRWASLVRRAEKSLREVAPGRTFRLVHPLRSGSDRGPNPCNVFDAVRRPGHVATICECD